MCNIINILDYNNSAVSHVVLMMSHFTDVFWVLLCFLNFLLTHLGESPPCEQLVGDSGLVRVTGCLGGARPAGLLGDA